MTDATTNSFPRPQLHPSWIDWSLDHERALRHVDSFGQLLRKLDTLWDAEKIDHDTYEAALDNYLRARHHLAKLATEEPDMMAVA